MVEIFNASASFNKFIKPVNNFHVQSLTYLHFIEGGQYFVEQIIINKGSGVCITDIKSAKDNLRSIHPLRESLGTIC